MEELIFAGQGLATAATDEEEPCADDNNSEEEETDDDPDRLTRDTLFVVDPIDGTRAFLAGKKTWCVSVAVPGVAPPCPLRPGNKLFPSGERRAA